MTVSQVAEDPLDRSPQAPRQKKSCAALEDPSSHHLRSHPLPTHTPSLQPHPSHAYLRHLGLETVHPLRHCAAPWAPRPALLTAQIMGPQPDCADRNMFEWHPEGAMFFLSSVTMDTSTPHPSSNATSSDPSHPTDGNAADPRDPDHPSHPSHLFDHPPSTVKQPPDMVPFTVRTFTLVEVLLVSYQFAAMLLNALIPRRRPNATAAAPATQPERRLLRTHLPWINSVSAIVQVVLLSLEFLKRVLVFAREEEEGLRRAAPRDSTASRKSSRSPTSDARRTLAGAAAVEGLMAQNRALLRRNAELAEATQALRGLLAAEREAKAAIDRIHAATRAKADRLEVRVVDLEAALETAREALAAAAAAASSAGSCACGRGSSDSGFAEEDAVTGPVAGPNECHDSSLSEKIDGALAEAARLEDPTAVTDCDRYLFERFGIVSAAMAAFNEQVEKRKGGLEEAAAPVGAARREEEEDEEGEADGEQEEEEEEGGAKADLEERGWARMHAVAHGTEADGGDETPVSVTEGPLGATDEFVEAASDTLQQPLTNGSTPLSLSVLLDDLCLKHAADRVTCARSAIRALLVHTDLTTAKQYPNLAHPDEGSPQSAAARRVGQVARAVLERHLTLLSLQAPAAAERVALLGEVEKVCLETRVGGLGWALRQVFPVLVLELYKQGVVAQADVLCWWRDGGGAVGAVRGGVRKLVETLEAAAACEESEEEEEDDDDDDDEDDDDEDEESEEEEEEDEDEDVESDDDDDEVVADVPETLRPSTTSSLAPPGRLSTASASSGGRELRVSFVGV
ncbi:hypothetical protein HDU96_005982 [Phlyctochytrium bullatum]|nr:hypothetical protein HDU96_005982 [Phlyctochytrium bullatum]